jgi:hypothetical protein
MGDEDWLNFYRLGAILQYMLGNGILGGLQFIWATILIRDTLPNHHISVFALGSILTDLLARFSLRQPFFSTTTLGLLITAGTCTTTLFRAFTPTKRPSPAPKTVLLGITIAFLVHILIFGLYFLAQDHQPIITLMESASKTFHSYVQSSTAPTLRAVVRDYETRWGRPPPPGFDIWFQFATDRQSKVLVEFDQINEDLRPFWGIEPRVLRERVAMVGGNEGNDFAVIRIREKKAEIPVAPQHRVPSPLSLFPFFFPFSVFCFKILWEMGLMAVDAGTDSEDDTGVYRVDARCRYTV